MNIFIINDLYNYDKELCKNVLFELKENKNNKRENVIDIISSKFALDTSEAKEIVELYFANSNLYNKCYNFKN